MRLNDKELVFITLPACSTDRGGGDLTLFLSEELWDSYQWDYLRCVW